MLLVEVQQRLAVRAGGEAMPLPDELCAQLAVVVDLAVGDQPDRSVLVRQRLVPTGEVDDRQSAHAQRHGTVDVAPLVVGAAVDRAARHPVESRRHRGRAAELEEAVDAAHGQLPVSACAVGALPGLCSTAR